MSRCSQAPWACRAKAETDGALRVLEEPHPDALRVLTASRRDAACLPPRCEPQHRPGGTFSAWPSPPGQRRSALRLQPKDSRRKPPSTEGAPVKRQRKTAQHPRSLNASSGTGQHQRSTNVAARHQGSTAQQLPAPPSCPAAEAPEGRSCKAGSFRGTSLCVLQIPSIFGRISRM